MEEVINTTENTEVDYVQAIQELKANSVPKEQYAKLKDENSKLLKSLINGETLDATQLPDKPDIAQLRKDLYGGESHFTNLEYISKVLELRDAVIESGGQDPFLPFGSKVMPDNNDIECANRVATVLKDCIEYADGDSGVFTAEVQRRMVDAAPKRK